MSVSEYAGRYDGERVFLLGNGPSLEQTPIELLEDEYTLAMNKIDVMFNSTRWRPDFYINFRNNLRRERVAELESIVEQDIECFFCRDGFIDRGFDFLNESNVEFVTVETPGDVKLYPLPKDIDTIWSDDPTQRVYRKYTTLYAAAQLVTYMGFTELYFLGCDLYPVFQPFPYMIFQTGTDPNQYVSSHHKEKSYTDFLTAGGRPVRSLVNGVSYALLQRDWVLRPLYEVYSRRGKTTQTHCGGNHHSDYYKVGKNNGEREAHQAIREIGKRKGFKTYNATVGGHLEVHPRVAIEEIL